MVLHFPQMPPCTQGGYGVQGMVLLRLQMPPITEPGPGALGLAGGEAMGFWAAGAARLDGRGMVLRKQKPLAQRRRAADPPCTSHLKGRGMILRQQMPPGHTEIGGRSAAAEAPSGTRGVAPRQGGR